MDIRTSERELQRLMRAGLAGDADAHRTLLTLASGRLRAYFRARLVRLGHGSVEAEDLVQEVLMGGHTRRHTYDPSQLSTAELAEASQYTVLRFTRGFRETSTHVTVGQVHNVVARARLGDF